MPMWVFDAETMGFLSVNDAAVQHYGYSREKFLKMQLREIWPEDEWVSHGEARCARSASPIAPPVIGVT